MKDKSKYSAASKKRWVQYTKEQRAAKMSELVKKRWEKMTAEELSEHGKKLSNARKNKTPQTLPSLSIPA